MISSSRSRLISFCGCPSSLIHTLIVEHRKKSSSSSNNSKGEEYQDYSSAKATHFGFEEVTEKEKAHKVKSVFENVADSYDLMNDFMSVGVHRVWKDMFIHRLHPSRNMRLIDVAGGTGDIAFRFLKWKKFKPSISQIPLPFDLNLPGEGSLPGNEVSAQYKAMEDNTVRKSNENDSLNER
jgi:hypothetical protein